MNQNKTPSRNNLLLQMSNSVFGFIIASILNNFHGWGWIRTHPYVKLKYEHIIPASIWICLGVIIYLLFWERPQINKHRIKLIDQNWLYFIIMGVVSTIVSILPYIGYVFYITYAI